MSWLGLDIGGANIKVADGNGFATSTSFALWREPDRLAEQLRDLIMQVPATEGLAVTMTGELADCFETKSAGVQAILDAVESAAAGRELLVYFTDGSLVTPAVAREQPLAAAAANWHVLARFVGQFAPNSPLLLIDVGSTTTDIIPIDRAKPMSASLTDLERLKSGELVYTGVERTPICSIIQAARYRGELCPLARELFAATADVYVILGDMPEDPNCNDTCDGRPLTKAASRKRLSRMFCADETAFHHRDAIQLAELVAEQQANSIATAIQRVLTRTEMRPAAYVLSGHGEYLALRALEAVATKAPTVSLTKELGHDVARCAPAHALAVLAAEVSAE